VEEDLHVRIGIPEGFTRVSTVQMEHPHRLKLNLHSERKVTLETMHGAPHKGFDSIVFQFSDAVDSTQPYIHGNQILLKFLNATTNLKPHRKYRTFDSWVTLRQNGEDLDVRICTPKGFKRFSTVQMTYPHRLKIDLYVKTPEPVSNPSQFFKDAVNPSNPEPYDASDHKPVEPDGSKISTPEDLRQMERIEARILSRKGFHEKSLEIYHRLREQYPEDEAIWEDYIETLVDSYQYESAQTEISTLLKKNPNNVRAKRIQARIYMELRQYTWTFQVFDQLLSVNRTDAGIWADYAFARLDAQEWSPALDYLCRVLEIDPENREALRGVHEILKTHRPRLDVGFFNHHQEAGDATVKTALGRYSQHLTERTYLDLNYDAILIDRPESPGVVSIDEDVSDIIVRLRHQFNRYWQGRVGGGGYSGLGDDATVLLGADYSPKNNLTLRADFIGKRPWYDPIEAALFDGAYNQLAISLDWSYDPTWGLFLGAEQWDYFLENDQDYGQARNFIGILTKRLWERPNFSLSYSYYYSNFEYEDDTVTPVEMIPNQGVHAISAFFEYRPCTYWSLGISGGPRWDVIRNMNSWWIWPILRIRFGNRIESSLSYEFNSESDTAAGGKTQTLRFWTRIIF
jgi:tetratricopeptide (TPR) repeat protein